MIVPPTWDKAGYHELLAPVWRQAAKELGEAEYIFIIGYSMPETDAFFKLLYGLGTVGDTPIRMLQVYNIESIGGGVETRFRKMLGTGAERRFQYIPQDFSTAIGSIREILGIKI